MFFLLFFCNSNHCIKFGLVSPAELNCQCRMTISIDTVQATFMEYFDPDLHYLQRYFGHCQYILAIKKIFIPTYQSSLGGLHWRATTFF